MVQGAINQKDITILNVYVANNNFKIHRGKTDRTEKVNKFTLQLETSTFAF